MAIEFTVDHNDEVANDAGIEPLIGWVTATVETRPGNYRVRDLGGPTPRALKLEPRKGYLAADGHMYKDQTLDDEFRLVANDPVFNLRELTYRFDFDLTTLAGVPVSIPFCRGPAPSSDTTLHLARLMNDLDQPVFEVRTKGYAEDILDARATGIASIKAATPAEGREAIEFDERYKALRTVIDLRNDFPEVRAGNWNRFGGVSITNGSRNITGATQLTSADEGKIALLLIDAPTQQWWMTSIEHVGSNGNATLTDNAPATRSNIEMDYGFDSGSAVNDAMAEISASVDGPVAVTTGGAGYRSEQFVIPYNVRQFGLPWARSRVAQLASVSERTTFAQLPGAEKDFIVFDDAGGNAGWLAFNGLCDVALWGPEKTVDGMTDATTGHGVAFARSDGTPLIVADGFRLERVVANNFPGSGFRAYGGIPFYVNECKAYYNGRFGFEFEGGAANAVHITNFSGDWSNLGLIGFKGLNTSSTVFISGVKSEGTISSDDAVLGLRSGPGYQSRCLVFDNCSDTKVLINGVSHIRVNRVDTAPGPAITVTGGSRPKISYNAVYCRIIGDEIGSIADAVTLRDEVTNLDVPRTVNSGFFPALYSATFDAPLVTGIGAVGKDASLALYNTTDRVTDYDRVRAYWSSNVLRIASEKGGTGSLRDIVFDVATTTLTLSGRGLEVARDTNTNTSLLALSGVRSASSIVQAEISLTPTINQTGTAGYTCLLVNPTESATGSGVKLLADLQVGGTSKFKVDSTGATTTATSSTVPTIYGSASSGGSLQLHSTSHATKGFIYLGSSSGYDGANKRLGIGTQAPTHTLTLDSTATGLALYNTADQTTNYERLRQYWSSNVATIATESLGTGTLRNLALGVITGGGFRGLTVSASASSSGRLQLAESTSAANVAAAGVTGSFTASSGVNVGLAVGATLAQTSTAGYTALQVNATETSTGSGTKRLIDAQVGGTSKFSVDNAGKVSVSGTAATISSGTGTPESVVTAPVGSMFLRTDGGATTTVYVKESGSGNTGWVAK